MNNCDEFLETTFFNQNNYGTSFKDLNRIIEQGKIPLLDLDLEGVKKSCDLLGKCNYFGVWIYVQNLDILSKRLAFRYFLFTNSPFINKIDTKIMFEIVYFGIL